MKFFHLMRKIEIIFKKLIYDLAAMSKSNDMVMMDNFLRRVYFNGKLYELKKALKEFEIEWKLKQGILVGELECCYLDNIELIKEKISTFFEKEIEINNIVLNKNLILGGIFRANSLELNFSLLNILQKWMI